MIAATHSRHLREIGHGRKHGLLFDVREQPRSPTDILVVVVPLTNWKVLESVVEIVQTKYELLELVRAFRSPRSFTSSLNGR